MVEDKITKYISDVVQKIKTNKHLKYKSWQQKIILHHIVPKI